MVVAIRKKSAAGVPSSVTIRQRAASIRREWSAREHSERYQLANLCQRRLLDELCGH